MITVEEMLQIGYDCGLEYVDEAYGQVMNHYDLFFTIDKPLEISIFQLLLREKGLLKISKNPTFTYEFHHMTIVNAAKMIGYELKEMEYDNVTGEIGDVDWIEP